MPRKLVRVLGFVFSRKTVDDDEERRPPLAVEERDLPSMDKRTEGRSVAIRVGRFGNIAGIPDGEREISLTGDALLHRQPRATRVAVLPESVDNGGVVRACRYYVLAHGRSVVSVLPAVNDHSSSVCRENKAQLVFVAVVTSDGPDVEASVDGVTAPRRTENRKTGVRQNVRKESGRRAFAPSAQPEAEVRAPREKVRAAPETAALKAQAVA